MTLSISSKTESHLMKLTRFKILELKRLFPLLGFARLWGQSGELSLFALRIPFAHMNNLQLVSSILGAEHIFVPLPLCT